MNICKYYVNNKCTNIDCKFQHIDNICHNYFFKECNRVNCRFSHEYKFNQNKKRVKNTETFEPSYAEPSMRVYFNKRLIKDNEVCIVNTIFADNDDIYNQLMSEVSKDVYVPWHGDTHTIADDRSEIDWKLRSPTFDYVITQLCQYFNLTPGATRLNFYDDNDWKPYHHDAAALKPEKAKYQNITVGVSFGSEREISFESAEDTKYTRKTINFPLSNGTVYAFGNKINTDFRHGIPPITNKNKKGRISVIIWGYSNFILKNNDYLISNK